MLTLLTEGVNLVTVQDIQKREEELKGVEQQALIVLKEKVPERRFGAGVSVQQQQNVLKRREEAQNFLVRIKEQRGELKTARAQIAENERIQAQIQQAQKRAVEYKKGFSFAIRGITDPGLSKVGREGFRDAKAGLEAQAKYQSQVEVLKKEGLKPVIVNNKIVGFEDTIRGQSIPIENVPASLKTPQDISRYQRAGVIDVSLPQGGFTPAPAINQNKNIIQRFISARDERIKTKLSAAGLPTTPNYIQAYKREANPFTSSRLGLYNIAGVGGKRTIVDEYGRTLGTAKEPGPNVLNLGALGLGASPSRIATAVPKNYQTEAVAFVERIKGFTKVTVTTGTRATRGDPQAIYTLSQQFIKQSESRSFGVGKGFALRLERVNKIPSVQPTIKKAEIFTFSSASVGERLGTAQVIKQFKQARVTVPGPGSRSALVRSRTLQYDNTLDKDILAIVTLRNKAQPNILNFRAGTPRLKINRRTGDLSYTLRQPDVKGIIVEVQKEAGSGVKFLQPANIKKTPLSITFQEQKAIESLVSGSRSAAQKALKVPPIPKLNGKRSILSGVSVGVATGQSSGASRAIADYSRGLKAFQPKGTAKAQEEISVNVRTLPAISVKDLTVPKLKLDTGIKSQQTQRDFSIQQPRLSELPKLKLPQRTFTVQRPVQKQPPVDVGIPRPPRFPPKSPRNPPKVPPVPRPSFKAKGTRQPKTEGFRPFVIKKGERFFLAGPLPRGKALKLAENEATRTLRATFGAEPTGIKIKGKDVQFKPPKNIFRNYRIKQGKKIPLPNTFIQKRGKRLSFGGEIKEIQLARRIRL